MLHRSAQSPAIPKLSPQLRLISLIVAAAFFMQLLDTSIINTSLPRMAASFGISPLEMSMGVTVYLLATASFIPLSAWLAERFGARNVFLLAIALFTLASLACGLAQSLAQFVVARAFQGLGGALMTPVGRIMVLRNAEKNQILRATATIAGPALFAPVIGPFLGGFITTYFSWRWNFFINLPLGLAGMVLVWRHVPNIHGEARRRLDWRGFLFCALGLSGLLYGLETLVHDTLARPLSLALMATGAVFALLAIRQMRRAAAPLLDLTIFRVPTFAMSTLAAGTWQRLMINATPFLLPMFFQVVHGMNALQAGSLMLAYFLGNLVMKAVTTPTLARLGFRRVLVGNGLLVSVSMLAFGFLGVGTPQPLLIALLFLAGLARSMQFTAMNALAFADLAPPERSTASTITSILQHVSMLVGVALAVAILDMSQGFGLAQRLSLGDFRVTFAVLAGIGAISSLMFLRLSPEAGQEVSGHGLTRQGEGEE